MKLIPFSLIMALSVFCVLAPAWADPTHDKIAASLERIEKAVTSRGVTVVQQNDPAEDIIDDAIRFQMRLWKFQMVQNGMTLLTGQNATPKRRSVFGLTESGGAAGCLQGALGGGLAAHIGILGEPITTGTALILGCIAGQ